MFMAATYKSTPWFIKQQTQLKYTLYCSSLSNDPKWWWWWW